jgi:flagellar motor component MotA
MKMVKKIVLWTVVAFIVYAIIVSPNQAASLVQDASNVIVLATKSIASFFNQILTHR